MAARLASKPSVKPASWRCTASVTVSCMVALARAMPASVVSITGCKAVPTARALSATLSLSDCSMAAVRRAYSSSALAWKLCWLASNRSPETLLCCSIALVMACSRSTSAGITSACCCSNRKASLRCQDCECVCRVVAISTSSRCTASSRSRRHRAESRPSIAEVATPAIEVPKATARPSTGAPSEPRMACRSVALSSASPVPRRVAIMPSKVPSMPSSTSSPTRYGVRTGPGRAMRSPSTRRRTALRRLGCSWPSQVASPALAVPALALAAVSEAVACR